MLNFNTYEDRFLVEKISSTPIEKKEAFTVLYNRYSSRIYMYCKKAARSNIASDDIFQETFIKFLKAAESGVQIKDVKSYLLKIARNLCINTKNRVSPQFVELEEFHAVINENTAENLELANLIDEAMNLLPEDQAEAFMLQVYQGMSYNEIADFFEVPVTTVRNRVVRAKKKLRDILAPYLENTR